MVANIWGVDPNQQRRDFDWLRYNQGKAWYSEGPSLSGHVRSTSQRAAYAGMHGRPVGQMLAHGTQAPRGGMGRVPGVHLDRSFDRPLPGPNFELGNALNAIGTTANLIQSVRGARAAGVIQKQIGNIQQQQIGNTQQPQSAQARAKQVNSWGANRVAGRLTAGRTPTGQAVTPTSAPVTTPTPTRTPPTAPTGSTTRNPARTMGHTPVSGPTSAPTPPSGVLVPPTTPITSGSPRRGGTGPMSSSTGPQPHDPFWGPDDPLDNPNTTGVPPTDWTEGPAPAPSPTLDLRAPHQGPSRPWTGDQDFDFDKLNKMDSATLSSIHDPMPQHLLDEVFPRSNDTTASMRFPIKGPPDPTIHSSTSDATSPHQLDPAKAETQAIPKSPIRRVQDFRAARRARSDYRASQRAANPATPPPPHPPSWFKPITGL